MAEGCHKPEKVRRPQMTCTIHPVLKETLDLFCTENEVGRSRVKGQPQETEEELRLPAESKISILPCWLPLSARRW